jgi:hypothetical protein
MTNKTREDKNEAESGNEENEGRDGNGERGARQRGGGRRRGNRQRPATSQGGESGSRHGRYTDMNTRHRQGAGRQKSRRGGGAVRPEEEELEGSEEEGDEDFAHGGGGGGGFLFSSPRRESPAAWRDAQENTSLFNAPPQLSFRGGRRGDLAPFHVDNRRGGLSAAAAWANASTASVSRASAARRGKSFACDCCAQSFPTHYALLKHRERAHERLHAPIDTVAAAAAPGRHHHHNNTDNNNNNNNNRRDRGGGTTGNAAPASTPPPRRPMSRHIRRKLLSKHAQSSLMAEARVVASIRMRETVLETLRETARGMKKANHRVATTAIGAESDSDGGDDGGGGDNIDLCDVGRLISRLLALRRATCQFLLALDTWRMRKRAEEQARQHQEDEEEAWDESLEEAGKKIKKIKMKKKKKKAAKKARTLSSFTSGGGAPGGYVWRGTVYCEQIMRGGGLLAGCLGGGVLPKIIEQWMREELGAVVGPRNPLLLKKEMPREEKEEAWAEVTHAQMEGFMGVRRRRQRRRHMNSGASDDAAEAANEKSNTKALADPMALGGGDRGAAEPPTVSIVSRDWIWPQDDEDAISFRMKTRAVMLLGRLLGKTKLREQETDALWLRIGVEAKKNEDDDAESGGEAATRDPAKTTSTRAPLPPSAPTSAPFAKPDRDDDAPSLERLMARLLDPCSDAAASSSSTAAASAAASFILTADNIERAFHVLRHENMREHLRRRDSKRRATSRHAAVMAPAFVAEADQASVLLHHGR